MRSLICLTFLGCVIAAPALAQTSCVAPDRPGTIDGAAATRDQIKAAVGAAKKFIASSDAYQACLGKEIDDQKAAVTADKPFNRSIATRNLVLADANQKSKEIVGATANAALAAYNKAHHAS